LPSRVACDTIFLIYLAIKKAKSKMPSHVVVLAGPPSSGKTESLLAHYRTVLTENEPGAALWLAPTWRAVSAVRDRLLDSHLTGCFQPGVMTFANFAAEVLKVSPDPIRPLTDPMKRQLVRQLIDGQNARGRLKHFRSIANTSGLVDLVVEFLSELKRLEIWPEHFRKACDARGISAKDEELLEIYESYQQSLLENQLFDAEGSFWSARHWLRQGQRRPFENLRFVVADGFSDFTRTQHEILEILADRVQSLSITLTLEPPPCRDDLFTKPLKTLAELQKRHANLQVRLEGRETKGEGGRGKAEEGNCKLQIEQGDLYQRPTTNDQPAASSPFPLPPSPFAALRHLEQHLFGNPREPHDAETTAGIEILAAARPIGEMEMIGSRIKRLLVEDGAKPGDIAVVFRSPQDSGSLTAEVFERLGLPVAWEQGVRLDRVPLLRALVALLKLDQDDWPFDSLLAVLGGNYFQPSWPAWQNGQTAAPLECLVRKFQIPAGRNELLSRTDLQSVNENPTDSDPLSSPFEKLSFEILAQLAAAFDELPQKATLPDWAKAWEKLARQIGMLRGLDWNGESHGSSLQKTDALAWKMLLSALSAGDRLAGWLKQSPPEFTRDEAFRALTDILGSERLPSVGDESGRIRVLSASSVRSLHIPYLFLAGLCEKAFPPPDREDRLYSEAEYARLIEHDLPLVTRSERNREEMLLFYEAVARATKRLYLSYPALDDSAQPLSPSPFLLEVEQACGKDKIAKIVDNDFRPVKKTDQPFSPSEFRLAAMSEAIEGNPRWLASLKRMSLGAMQEQSQQSIKNLFAGLELTLLRQDYERFGPAEGIFLGEQSKKVLHKDFSPSRTFSVTELESYAGCPYRYLIEKILKIKPLDDIALETDYRERGQKIHAVLATFHQKINGRHSGPTSPAKIDQAEFDELLQVSLQEHFPAHADHSLRAAMQEIDRRMIEKWLGDYRRQHEAYDNLWADCDRPPAPEFFEISFGLTKHASTSWAIAEPLELPDGQNVVRLSGRIDRVDTGFAAKHNIFTILDYKTGSTAKFSADDFLHGESLQLPIYAVAVMELFLNDRDAVPWQAGYWLVAKNGYNHKHALKIYHRGENGLEELEDEWETLRAKIGEIVADLIHGIRDGAFPVFNRDDKCTSYCPFSTICRINQIRSLDKVPQGIEN
jgi:ATP-dependent helicase/DNAse subunit B